MGYTIDEMTIVNNLMKFVQSEDFAKGYNNRPFTLMVSFELGTVAHSLITDVLKPLKGTIVCNPAVVSEKVKPVLRDVFKVY
ncbi:hypothetical protein [Flavobacterium sp. GSA192]|uniref:hypothetical protein n=1 Tax=Flavobacterium sp. GSA192 TaxID=2576304 RepID=UPI00112A29B7|nr:hypothetical protein [Flavobacterium sp. GSA192]